jgi:hypothetical protein
VRRGFLVLALAAVCAVAALPASAGAPVRVTVISDSVGAALLWNPGVLQTFSAGLEVRGEAFGCRKLVALGCTFAPDLNPPSALAVIEQLGAALGPVAVIDVGYNDEAETYAAGLDTVMRALVANGVQRVIWVTLEETEGVWVHINQTIRAAPERWPQLTVADWGAVPLDPTWFQDVVHLNDQGAIVLGKFLRPIVLAQVQLVVDTLPPVLHLPAVIHARATSATGRVIRVEPVAVDATDGVVPVTCTPASPHRFRVGRTRVTCSAVDQTGNEASGGFDVYVSRAAKGH